MTGRVTSASFVGRQAELGRLHWAWQSAAAGEPKALLIGGEAGVGKTRLVQEFVQRVGDQAQVLVGSCVQLSGGGLPYGPIVDALRGLTRNLDPAGLDELSGSAPDDLTRLLPGVAPPRLSEPVSEFRQARLFELLLRFLDRLSERAPVVLIVEDLHWADQSTLDMLRFLVSMVGRERLLLIATYRSDELHSGHPLLAVLAELDRSPRIDHLQLPRFDRKELAELLRGILGVPPPPETLQRVFSQSDGNAFLAEELIAAAGSQTGRHLSPRLQGLLLARIVGLAEDTRQVLQVAATIGRRVDHDLLAAASQLDEARLLTAVREAVDRQLLDAEGDAYGFRHVLLQEAVYNELLPGERRRLHAAVARALTKDPHSQALPQTAAELSHHWYASHDYSQALKASITAARAAADVYGFIEAHIQFERALTLWGQVPNAREQVALSVPELLLEAGEAARWAGAADRAVALTQQVLADVSPSIEPARIGALHARLGDYLSDTGDGKAAMATYEEACRLVANELSSPEKAHVLAAHGAALMRESHFEASRVRCQEAIVVARSVGARAQEGHALNTLGCDLAALGDLKGGIAALRRAHALAEETGTFDDISRAYYNLSAVLTVGAGRPEEALEASQQGLQRMRELGLELAVPGHILRGNVAWTLWLLGRWQEAENLTSDALTRELPAWFALHMHLLQGRLQLAQGRLELAQAQGEVAVTMAQQVSDPVLHASLQEYLAELLNWRGDHQAARAAVARGLGHLAETDETLTTIWLCNTGLRAEADAAERVYDRHTDAEFQEIHVSGEQLLAQARELLAGLGHGVIPPEASADAAGCEAEFSRLERHSDPERWAAVVASWDRLSRPYEASYARWRQAEALLTIKAARATATVLRQAHKAARELHAQLLLREIERLAKRGRIDLQTQGPMPRAAEASPAARLGLTPREQEVLQHLVEGRTNRQIARALFISEKTASVHVSNIMSKLGAANRSEAAAIAHRLRLPKPNA
jgi:DNA-binding CsgD family transcriptional regulator/tetratricopeptide (TPR) repeat protein